jgi:protein-tyrosine phosphatase
MSTACVEILPNLWLCDLRSACTTRFSNTVKCFISVCKSQPQQYNLFSEHIKDRLVVCRSFTHEVAELVALIDSNLAQLLPVVVFCETAHQRSPALVVAYLMVCGKMPYDDAVAAVQSKSSVAFETPCVYERLLRSI